MHVRIRSPERMDYSLGGFDQAIFNDAVRQRLDLRSEHRRAVLAVPGKMQIDLGIIVSAHRVRLKGGP